MHSARCQRSVILTAARRVASGSLISVHLDHLPGTFFGPSNLVELLRHRARCQPHDIAFTYLVDGEHEEVHLTLSRTRSASPGDRRLARSARFGGRAGAAALSGGPGIHRRLFRLLVRRRDRRAGLSAAAESFA